MQQLLTKAPIVAVVSEYLSLEAQGVARIADAAGREALQSALSSLFAVLHGMLSDYELEHHEEFDATPHRERLDTAQTMCTPDGLAPVALYMLRRKLRSLPQRVDPGVAAPGSTAVTRSPSSKRSTRLGGAPARAACRPPGPSRSWFPGSASTSSGRAIGRAARDCGVLSTVFWL